MPLPISTLPVIKAKADKGEAANKKKKAAELREKYKPVPEEGNECDESYKIRLKMSTVFKITERCRKCYSEI